MNKEIFMFSLADCELDDSPELFSYLTRLDKRINEIVNKVDSVLFFSPTIQSDAPIKARIIIVDMPEDCEEERGFAIELKRGGTEIISPYFDKACVIAIKSEYGTASFRHLFKDGDYLQTIKF